MARVATPQGWDRIFGRGEKEATSTLGLLIKFIDEAFGRGFEADFLGVDSWDKDRHKSSDTKIGLVRIYDHESGQNLPTLTKLVSS